MMLRNDVIALRRTLEQNFYRFWFSFRSRLFRGGEISRKNQAFSLRRSFRRHSEQSQRAEEREKRKRDKT